MAATVTKKVRLEPRQARLLTVVAKDLGLSESEVLRQGLAMMQGARDRRRNVEQLIALLGDRKEPRKPRYRTKW